MSRPRPLPKDKGRPRVKAGSLTTKQATAHVNPALPTYFKRIEDSAYATIKVLRGSDEKGAQLDYQSAVTTIIVAELDWEDEHQCL